MTKTTSASISLNRLTVAGLVTAIEASISLDIPLLVEGKPGIGKSDIVRQAASAAGYALLDRRASQMLPEDLGGIPLGDAERRRTVRCMPDLCAEAHDLHRQTGKPVMLFLDEVNLGTHGVLSGFYELVLDRRCGGYDLPEGTRIVAACNPAGNGSVVTELPRPLCNRMGIVHFTGPTFDEWEAYALKAGIEPAVLTALRVAPEFLHDRFDPDAERSPTPRAWMRASQIVAYCDHAGLSESMRMALIASVVGDEAAHKVAHIMSLASRIVPSRTIFASPDSVAAHPTLALALLQAFKLAGDVASVADTRAGVEWLSTRHPECLGLFVRRVMVRVQSEQDGARLVADASLLSIIHDHAGNIAAGDYLRK